MAKRRHTPEPVIKKLREAEVAIAEGGTEVRLLTETDQSVSEF